MIMRLTILLIIISTLTISAKSYSQKVTLNLRDVQIQKVFTQIREQTGCSFLWTEETLKGLPSVSVSVHEASLTEAVKAVLQGLPLTYNVHGNVVYIERETVPPLQINPYINPPVLPLHEITGSVTDSATGKPLIGVTIQVKGNTIGTTTNANGEFSLNVPENTVLVVSYLGYTSKEVVISGSNKIQIILSATTTGLNQLVVVGYGIEKKRDLTGSISTIKLKDIPSLPVPDIGQAIEGRAAGVQVISSGAPGSNVTFRIRGTGTINDADPLLVIDGIPTDIPLNTIDPDDIASIQVLKDASAAAIYGSRGANGVVIITTKKGSSGKGHLSFNFFTAVQNPTNVVKMLNAGQFAKLNNEMLANNGQPLNPLYSNPDSLGVGTNWLDALFKAAPMQSFTLSYSGGSDKYTYYVSGNFLDQQGIVIHTAFKRYNIQFNSEAKVFPWLNFGNNLTLESDEKPSGSYDIRTTMSANPTQPVFNPDGTWSGPKGNPMWYGDVRNPIGTATIDHNNTNGYNVLGSLYAEVKILPGLTFKTTGGLQAQFWDSRSWAPAYNWQPIPQPYSYLSEQYNKSITLLWDNYFTYDKILGSDHHINIMVGSDAQNNNTNYMNGNISDFASNLTQQLNNGTINPVVGGDASQWTLLSFMGRVNYSYKDKYLFTATLRRDGSSRFGSDNKWGTFPSASVAWRISKEKFFQHVNFVNDLKLRLGYGVTGNQNIGNYSFASALQTAQYVFNGNIVSTVFPNVLPNPDVKWETVKQSNVGLDATLFNDRINLTLDGYIKNTTNMLVPAIVPLSSGYSNVDVPFVNAGKVQNKGIELALSTQNLEGAFKWNTDVNVSYNQNKIVGLNSNTPLFGGSIGLNYYLNIDQAGHPINEFYGYVMQGIFQTQKQVDEHAVQVRGADPFNRTSPGDIEFMDLNNDGIISDSDRTYIGDPNPKFIFAMNNSFSFRGIDLTIFLQGVEGNKIFNANNIYQEGMLVAQNQTIATLKRWEGPGTSNIMPRAVFNDPNQNTRPSTRFIENGSYLRIKTITIGYTLPSQWTERIKFSSIRVYISCMNLYTFTGYSGFDPEIPVDGIDYSVYPVTRTLSLGVNLNL
ncbi:MAG: SusC/RagA family TonB-linked outer membrane protein [Chitinophagaceae bacterium]|nr:MAG: SusC/RagA family TonB-linked outer membrane protein [Chitinophagaceae bacterium]